MEEKKINAFVTNLGKYNEGQLVGEWVSFPVTREEMQAVFDRIGINNQYEEYFITDYDIDIPNLKLEEYESVDRINYLAGRLNELDDEELEKFEEIVSSGIDLYQTDGLEAYINLTYNLDTYDLYPDVNNEYDLGYYIVHEIGGYDLEAMGNLAMYIDYEALGRDAVINDVCAFSENGYVVYDNSKWYIEYDGNQESIPDKYCIAYRSEAELGIKKEMAAHPILDGYVWTHYSDGSGALENSVGEKAASYDLTTNEMSVCLPGEQKGKSHNYSGDSYGLDTVKRDVESYLAERIRCNAIGAYETEHNLPDNVRLTQWSSQGKSYYLNTNLSEAQLQKRYEDVTGKAIKQPAQQPPICR
ncbi:MAG: antirestriction protein ArdA [Bacteroides sp.]|nr:antirestriction protein ArdA [Bacteroides sp.]MCM1550523.1 antirestriction protein ArdA [Clostridium sp.]